MTALITGASSGIGRDMARELSRRGYDLILVARRQERLHALQEELPTRVEVIPMDLESRENCISLFEKVRQRDIQIVINNAGFGLFGPFAQTDLDRELEMIALNIQALHILTKLFYQKFRRENQGYLLNVASSAAFLPGPMLSAYYAAKAYVLRLTQAVSEEIRRDKAQVYLGVLCPGPVATEFDRVARVSFSVKGMSSQKVARIAIDAMMRRKKVIVPGVLMKFVHGAVRFVPDWLLLRLSYHMQHRKTQERSESK